MNRTERKGFQNKPGSITDTDNLGLNYLHDPKNHHGVITHLGESGESGHFVASCKSPVDNKWYRYNDSIVYLINDFNKEVEKFGTPYILFYQRDSK